MRTTIAAAALLAALALVLGGSQAGEKKGDKEVKLTGTITCAKCDLKQEKACMTVIVTKKGDKETVYHFDKAGHKEHHKHVCTEAKEGTVVGTVSKEGKKNIITVKSLEFK